ncbi:MAG: glutaredoxin 3 [Alphaproteobacteria bacterium]
MKKVIIYTTTYCPYCVKAKRLLEKKKVAYEEIDVTHNEALRDDMMKKAEGRRTVPQIFIEGKPIGGCDDLHALDASGNLDLMLA